MAWTIDGFWLGVSFVGLPCHVEVSSAIDIGSASYSPRTYRVVLDREFDVQGAKPIDKLTAILRYNGRIVARPLAQSVEIGVAPRGLLTFTFADRPALEGDLVPDNREPRVRSVDEEATQAAKNAAIKRGSEEAVEIWAGGGGKNSAFPKATADEWSTVYKTENAGRVYPLVIGKPGRDGTPAYAAIPLDSINRYLLVAGHELAPGDVTITKVRTDTGLTESAAYTISHLSDNNGRRVAVVILPDRGDEEDPPPAMCYEDGASYYVAFDSTSQGGLPNHPCDVMIYLASRVRGVRVDVRSVEALRGFLAPYVLDTALTQTDSAWRILTDSLVPILPVAIVPTSAGVGLARMSRFDDSPIAIRATAGVGIHRIGGITNIRPAQQSVSVAYAFSGLSGGTTRTATVDPARFGAHTLPDTSGTRLVDTPWIYDTATAQLVARDSAAWSLDRRPISYLVDPEMHGVEGALPLTVGTRLRLTDAEVSIMDREAYVVSESRSDGIPTIGIQVL